MATLRSFSQLNNARAMSALTAWAKNTVTTPIKHGHPINLHIKITDSINPSGIVMTSENSQNLEK